MMFNGEIRPLLGGSAREAPCALFVTSGRGNYTYSRVDYYLPQIQPALFSNLSTSTYSIYLHGSYGSEKHLFVHQFRGKYKQSNADIYYAVSFNAFSFTASRITSVATLHEVLEDAIPSGSGDCLAASGTSLSQAGSIQDIGNTRTVVGVTKNDYIHYYYIWGNQNILSVSCNRVEDFSDNVVQIY